MKQRKILFLDLDGTVRRSKDPSGFINKPEDIEVYHEVNWLLLEYHEAGWDIFFVSNQGGIAAGFTSELNFMRGVQETIRQLGLPEDSIPAIHCPHSVDADCICRKPRPGMPVQIINSLGVDEVKVSECLFVGDRPEDEECAKACGIPFMWADSWRSSEGPPA